MKFIQKLVYDITFFITYLSQIFFNKYIKLLLIDLIPRKHCTVEVNCFFLLLTSKWRLHIAIINVEAEKIIIKVNDKRKKELEKDRVWI